MIQRKMTQRALTIVRHVSLICETCARLLTFTETLIRLLTLTIISRLTTTLNRNSKTDASFNAHVNINTILSNSGRDTTYDLTLRVTRALTVTRTVTRDLCCTRTRYSIANNFQTKPVTQCRSPLRNVRTCFHTRVQAYSHPNKLDRQRQH